MLTTFSQRITMCLHVILYKQKLQKLSYCVKDQDVFSIKRRTNYFKIRG